MDKKQITDALRIGMYHADQAAAFARALARINAEERHMDGVAADYLRHADDATRAADRINNVLAELLKGESNA